MLRNFPIMTSLSHSPAQRIWLPSFEAISSQTLYRTSWYYLSTIGGEGLPAASPYFRCAMPCDLWVTVPSEVPYRCCRLYLRIPSTHNPPYLKFQAVLKDHLLFPFPTRTMHFSVDAVPNFPPYAISRTFYCLCPHDNSRPLNSIIYLVYTFRDISRLSECFHATAM